MRLRGLSDRPGKRPFRGMWAGIFLHSAWSIMLGCLDEAAQQAPIESAVLSYGGKYMKGYVAKVVKDERPDI